MKKILKFAGLEMDHTGLLRAMFVKVLVDDAGEVVGHALTGPGEGSALHVLPIAPGQSPDDVFAAAEQLDEYLKGFEPVHDTHKDLIRKVCAAAQVHGKKP